MNEPSARACDEFRSSVTLRLAGEPVAAGDHPAQCADCARYAELARSAWEAAGRSPDEQVPPLVSASLLNTCRRPRRTDLTLLRPSSVAAAAVLAVGAILFFWPAKAVEEERSLMESDGTSVERYDLPAGVAAGRVAEEIRREVAPETWGEGGSGLEVGEGYLRVHASGEVQRAVRELLKRYR